MCRYHIYFDMFASFTLQVYILYIIYSNSNNYKKDDKFDVGLEDTRGTERRLDMIQKSKKIFNQINRKTMP